MRSRRRSSSMRGGASPISTSSMRGRSRSSSARRWATASMAATIASRSVRGTSSPSVSHEAKLQARDDLNAPALSDLAALDDAGVPRAVLGLADQADRACAVPAQCADRHRQQRRSRCSTPLAEARLGDDEPLVRGAAVWADAAAWPARQCRCDWRWTFWRASPTQSVRTEWTQSDL